MYDPEWKIDELYDDAGMPPLPDQRPGISDGLKRAVVAIVVLLVLCCLLVVWSARGDDTPPVVSKIESPAPKSKAASISHPCTTGSRDTMTNAANWSWA